MYKTNDEITLAIQRLQRTLLRANVQVDTQVIQGILHDIIHKRVAEQLEQATVDWDLDSLVRMQMIITGAEQKVTEEPKLKQTRTKKTVQ